LDQVFTPKFQMVAESILPLYAVFFQVAGGVAWGLDPWQVGPPAAGVVNLPPVAN
jgi:hypothetical protein